MPKQLLLLLLITGACFSFCTAAKNTAKKLSKNGAAQDSIRDGKILSLFSIVTFKNTGCQSLSGTTTSGTNRNGTCYTSTECSDKGGTASGNCAAGFGVCCIFILNTATALTTSENCTYIQNPGYPSTYSATSSLTYTISKCSQDVCFLRLDFETFTLLGPIATDESETAPNLHNCQDTFSVTGSGGESTPTICGKNTGEHVYIDMGTAASGTATITLAFATTTSTVRTWEIKLTQVECWNRARPPSGCLQYHTGLTGRIETFNFQESTTTSQMHLISQQYSICIRPEQGYCCVEYTLCTDTRSWAINENAAAAATIIDSECSEDYVGISGVADACSLGSNAILHSRLCGGIFGLHSDNTIAASAVCDCTQPFTIDILTDATQDAQAPTAGEEQRGVCLNYQQISCSSLN